jgi:hypothetical protein
LDHESGDHPVKLGAIVKAALGELDEVLNVLGGEFREELDQHVAMTSFETDLCFTCVAHVYLFGLLTFRRLRQR